MNTHDFAMYKINKKIKRKSKDYFSFRKKTKLIFFKAKNIFLYSLFIQNDASFLISIARHFGRYRINFKISILKLFRIFIFLNRNMNHVRVVVFLLNLDGKSSCQSSIKSLS